MANGMPPPGWLRRTLICPTGLCSSYLTLGDEEAVWNHCIRCGRRDGYTLRSTLRAEEKDAELAAARRRKGMGERHG